MTTRNTIRWEDAGDGVVNLVLDDPDANANTANVHFMRSLEATIERIEGERDTISGIVITSAKPTFFAGADLNEIKALDDAAVDVFAGDIRMFKASLRRLETLGIPVVAAMNGAALGGGYEIALACHHRIVVDTPKAVVGLPEVQLGVLAGGGGIVRTVRMLGIVDALMNVLLNGKRYKPQAALKAGLIHEVVASADELLPAAKAWIAANPEAQQPWDVKGYKMPGGTPSSPKLAVNLAALPANLRKQLKGAPMPAPKAIMAAAVEGAQVDVDSAMEIEGRYFISLLKNPVSKAMIQAFFFDMQRVNGDRGRPKDREPERFEKLIVLGAGMMGAAIAYVSAQAGMDVVLKDISLEAAQQGKAYSEKLVAKGIEKGRVTEEQGQALLDRIHPTADPKDAEGCDVVIECVFEDPELKIACFNEVEPHLAEGALLCSNTSTLPITQLAAGTSRPEDFIGTHFFSPVDKMPPLEIIQAEQGSRETLFRALDLAKQIRKTPIVVNDRRGFFTSRTIMAWGNEAQGMLAEGVPPATIERACLQAGYPVGALQLNDEIDKRTAQRVQQQTELHAEAEGISHTPHPDAARVNDTLINLGRCGRVTGAGTFDYDPETGKRLGFWAGLAEHFPPVEDPSAIDLQELIDRLLIIEALEAAKCFGEGVVDSPADANVGSIIGIGYPAWTGGVITFINNYEGGPAGFVARARELAARYGERFEPPASLVEMAERGERYVEPEAAVAA